MSLLTGSNNRLQSGSILEEPETVDPGLDDDQVTASSQIIATTPANPSTENSEDESEHAGPRLSAAQLNSAWERYHAAREVEDQMMLRIQKQQMLEAAKERSKSALAAKRANEERERVAQIIETMKDSNVSTVIATACKKDDAILLSTWASMASMSVVRAAFNQPDKAGSTPLFHCAWFGSANAAKVLLSYGTSKATQCHPIVSLQLPLRILCCCLSFCLFTIFSLFSVLRTKAPHRTTSTSVKTLPSTLLASAATAK